MQLVVYDVLRKDRKKVKNFLEELINCDLADSMHCQDHVATLHGELMSHTCTYDPRRL